MAIPIPLIASGLAALGIGGAQQATEDLSPEQKLDLLKKAGQTLTGTSGIMAMKDKLPEKKEEEEEEKKPEPEFEPDIPDLPKKKEEEYEKKIGPRSPTELDSMNVRVGTTEGNLKGVDAGIEGLLLDLNNSGYITTQSDSGIMEDYKESERGNQGMGYISFWNDENSSEKLNEIKDAAEKAGLVVNPDSKIFFKDALTIRTDITKDGSVISQLRKKANQSAAENLINLGLAKEEDFGVYTGTLTSSKNEYDPYAPKSGTKTSKGERLFDIWLDERDKITKNLIKDAGGPLSDKDVKSKWVSFYNNLFDKPKEKAKGGFMDKPLYDIKKDIF